MNIDRSKKFTDFFTKFEGKRQINALVLHHIEANSVEKAIEMLEESEVSAHFLIGEDGKIFQLVDENDIAYHAGVSCWRGVDGLNKTSIGIEFLNSAAFSKKFEKAQMLAGLKLCKYLIAKYNIAKGNVVGHSDIAYFADLNSLDRKQDPSHLFDWVFLAENGVGVHPKSSASYNIIMFKIGDKNHKILMIKQKLAKFGYKVMNFSDEFDFEMQSLAKVFNRRFVGIDSDSWSERADDVLGKV